MGSTFKLDLPDDVVSGILENGTGRNARSKQHKKKGNGRGNAPRNKRATMAHGKYGRKAEWKTDVIMLESGLTSHLTPLASCFYSKIPRDVSFTIADNLQMRTTHSGVLKVQMSSEKGIRWVSLSNDLVVSDAGMNLMTVSALVKKEIGLLFMPGYAVLFDLLE